MTSSQKKIVQYWLCLVAWLILYAVVHIYQFQNKQLAFLLIAVTALILLISNKKYLEASTGYGVNKLGLLEYMNENPALKKLVVCFSALVLPYVIYQIVISGGEPKPLIALAMGGNILPAEILSEYQKYKKAGKDA